MNFIKQDLLTLLISLFLFAGCKNNNSIGLDIDANNAIKGDLVNNEVVMSNTVRSTDVSTAGISRYPIGYMDDAVFGKTEASLALTINPPSVNYDFGLSAQLDSVILVLKLDSIAPNFQSLEPTKFYGDTINSVYSIDVHQLSTPVTSFASNTNHPYNSDLLGNFTGKIKPSTPVKITDIVVGKADTLKSVAPQLRIKLSKEFFQGNIVETSTLITTSNAAFVTAFKGLSVSINKTTSSGLGGISFVNLSNANSYLQLVYKKTNDNASIDTVSVNYPIIGAASSTTVSHNYTGTDIQTQLDNPTTQYDVTYAQGLIGVKTKISFPSLKNFTATYGKAAINKAELVVPAVAGSTAYPFGPLVRLSLYRADIAGQPTQLPDHPSATADGTFGGYYDSLNNRYIFVITSYVQSLIDGKLIDYGAYLAPSAPNEFQLAPTATAAGRTVIGANGNTTNKLKLNIYYTKIN
ncbi:hypothetical protein ACVWYG_003279 [Pedobacter sp. UYEF25]